MSTTHVTPVGVLVAYWSAPDVLYESELGVSDSVVLPPPVTDTDRMVSRNWLVDTRPATDPESANVPTASEYPTPPAVRPGSLEEKVAVAVDTQLDPL